MEGQSGGGAMEKGEGGGKTRIYVGGLGESVTADDLKKTFSTPQLGFVQSVDLIRTKDRGFAYLDFVPSSDHSLLKLFSKYNGCMWKGGRLRLEKAKEHFLLRLKREWEEDAEVSSDSSCPPSSAVAVTCSLDKPMKNHNLEKRQLHIYFPKLRKIKLLPFKGSGKHKYSFQRVEVPPFPIHFCDCEEHSASAYTSKENVMEIKMGGVDEKELNIMTSVLNKIFERENRSETTFGQGDSSNQVQNLTSVADDSMAEEAIDDNDDDHDIDDDDDDNDDDHDIEDDDDIIINVVGRKNYGIRSSFANVGSSNQVLHLTNVANASMVEKPMDDDDDDDDDDDVDDDDGIIINVVGRKKYGISSSYATGQKSDKHDQKLSTKVKNADEKIKDSRKRKRKVPEDGQGGAIDNLPVINDRKHSSHAQVGDAVDARHLEPKSYSPQPNCKVASKRDMRADATHHTVDVEVDSSSGKKGQCNQSGKELQSDEKDQEKPEQLEAPKQIGETSSSKENSLTNKSGRGDSWRHTCSWAQLVSDTRNSSFSISQILPDFSFESPELSKMEEGTIIDQPTAPGSSTEEKKKNAKVAVSTLDNHQQDRVNNEEKKRPLILKQMPLPQIGETCSFTRNAESMKKWNKAKAALSVSLRKKDK